MADLLSVSAAAAPPTSSAAIATSTLSGDGDVHPIRTIGDKMKAFEKETTLKLDPTRPYMVRLDGHRFSKYTSSLHKPYDVRLHHAMLATTVDLFERFLPAAAYTESDEISLVFAPVDYYRTEEDQAKAPSTLPYGGKVQKISSLLAGYCSSRFNHHFGEVLRQHIDEANPCLNELLLARNAERFSKKSKGHSSSSEELTKLVGEAYFDARAFQLPCLEDCLENLIWRSRDASRNSKSLLGRVFFSTKALHAQAASDVIKMVEDKHQVVWSELPMFYRSGTLLKRSMADKQCTNPITGEQIVVKRSVTLVSGWQRLDHFDQQHTELLFCKKIDSESFPEQFGHFEPYELYGSCK